MTKTFFIQTETDTNKITDVIEYAHDGYSEIQLETPLPSKIIGGAYKLLGGSAIYVPEWDVELNELKAEQQELSDTIAQLIMGV